MILILKIILALSLLLIFLQDLKERKVYLILYIISGCLMAYLYYIETTLFLYFFHIGINLSIVGLIVLILYLYSKIILRKPLAETFGIGDLCFFLVVALGLSTTTFLVLFSFSLLFSAFLFVIMKLRTKIITVPLAGYQALFFTLIFMSNWLFSFTNLYSF